MTGRDLRIVEKTAPVGKAVRRHVEDAHDLRLLQPDSPRSAHQRRMDLAQVRPLRLRRRAKLGRQRRQRTRHVARRYPLTRNHAAAFAHDKGEAAGPDHRPAKADGLALLALRAVGEGDRADVELASHGRALALSKCLLNHL
jgi:hypothetical protein